MISSKYLCLYLGTSWWPKENSKYKRLLNCSTKSKGTNTIKFILWGNIALSTLPKNSRNKNPFWKT